MLIEQTLEKLTAMKLGAMAEAVQQPLGSDEAMALSFEDRLGVLVDTEWTAREQRKLTRRLRAAKLRYAASLEAVDFTHPRRLKRHIHEALIRNTHHDRLVGHLSRDSTAIEVREKPTTKENAPEPPKRKRGRPKKGEARPKQLTRLQRQGTMTTSAMLDDLPTDCAVGTKKNSKGHKETWIGYKLHLDVADGQIPISCILTSASLHDSQAAIPLATVSAERTTNLYDLMDAAYDAQEIRDHSRSLGHVPLIDINTRRNTSLKDELNAEARRRQLLGFQLPADVRYHERTAGERVNGRLKDEFGARHVRVRGAAKVMCHCMFGVLALTADQLLRLVT